MAETQLQIMAAKELSSAEIQGIILTAYDAKVIHFVAKDGMEKVDMEAKRALTSSALNRSRIAMPKDFPSVRSLFSKSTDWKEVVNIGGESSQGERTFQGKMPPSVRAFASFITVAELYRQYGPEGNKYIAVNKGRKNPNEFFLSVPFEVETKDVTVNLREDEEGNITFINFWAGIAHKSVVDVGVNNIAGHLVHCNNPPLNH